MQKTKAPWQLCTALTVLLTFPGMQFQAFAQEAPPVPEAAVPPMDAPPEAAPEAIPAPPALAAPEAPAPAVARGQEPPARVGRLAYVSGTVSFKPAGVDEWTQAPVNRPVTRGDTLYSDENSRAEVHVGTLAVRLGAKTSLYVSNLDDRTVQLNVAQGTAQVRLREVTGGELVEVDLPNAAVTLTKLGDYRIDVEESGDTSRVTVRHGEAEVLAAGAAFDVEAHRTALLQGTGQVLHSLGEMPPRDAFDDWCASRDRREDNPPALKYVSRATVGYEDLDDNGSWESAPDYGSVWVPRTVPVGWSPYHYGHWAWVDPWGWTWVDAAPWGFAPFHYGRWAYWGSRWAWVPGPVIGRPCYAPALVGFLAGAALVGAAASVAWFPLAPREPYVPGYYVSYNYLRHVNQATNVTNITNVSHITNNVAYVNRSAPGGVMAISRANFGHGQPVNNNLLPINHGALGSAAVTGYTAQVAPGQAGILGAGHLAPRPQTSAFTRPLVSRTVPPPAPTPFTARQAALNQNPGHPVSYAPVVTRPLPVGQQHGMPPVMPHPGSAYVHPAPEVYRVPQPAHPVPAPGYPQPTPQYRPAPGYHPMPSPAFHPPAPQYHPAPVRPAPAPHYAPAPVFHPAPMPHVGGGGGGGHGGHPR